MKRIKLMSLSAVLGLSLSVSASVANDSVTRKAASLMGEPYNDAKVLMELPQNTSVKLLERKGGWSKIEVKGKQGWMRTLNLNINAQASGADALGSTIKLATGRAGSGNIVATTGVRGLGEEELKEAQFNAEQIALAESYRVDTGTASAFAAKASLKAQQVPYREATTAPASNPKRKGEDY